MKLWRTSSYHTTVCSKKESNAEIQFNWVGSNSWNSVVVVSDGSFSSQIWVGVLIARACLNTFALHTSLGVLFSCLCVNSIVFKMTRNNNTYAIFTLRILSGWIVYGNHTRKIWFVHSHSSKLWYFVMSVIFLWVLWW